MHVTVASAERSFSKFKLLKNNLRSGMSQERLNGLKFYALRINFWMRLILILSSMTLHRILRAPDSSFASSPRNLKIGSAQIKVVVGLPPLS